MVWGGCHRPPLLFLIEIQLTMKFEEIAMFVFVGVVMIIIPIMFYFIEKEKK